MFVIEKQKNEMRSLPAREIDAVFAKHISSNLAQRILRLLVKEPMYPKGIAKALKVHEQKVY